VAGPLKLGEPTWSAQIESIRFFNGRVLTGDDLTREQDAVARRDADLAAAIGPGVVRGLFVTAVAGTNPARVKVGSGAAIAPDGGFLELDAAVELDLVVPTVTTAPTPGTFRVCGVTSGTITTTGPGVYVLVAQIASKDDGRAEVGGVERHQADPCTADHRKAGIAFRLQRLESIEAALPTDDRRRSHAAHLCLGTVTTGSADPMDPDRGEPGRRAIDDLRVPNAAGTAKLAACEVPLALLELQAGSTPLRWLDVWAARRRAAATHDATPATGAMSRAVRMLTDAARAEREAVVAQFADQYGGTVVNAAAASRYPWLPPCGLLAAAEAWPTFLAVHAPPAVTTVDPGLLPAILEGSVAADPFATRKTSGPLAPEDAPVVVDVFQAVEGGPLVFARSRLGRLRVELTGPTLSSGAGIRVVATGPQGDEAVGVFVAATSASGAHWVVDRLVPGSWTVKVDPGVVEMTGSPASVAVVGGRLARASVPVQHGASITVNVTNADIAASSLLVTIAGQAATVSSARSATKGALAAGSYAVSVSAIGYTTYSTTVVLDAGEDETVTVTLAPIPQEQEVPDCCLTTMTKNRTKVELCLRLLAWHLVGKTGRYVPDYQPDDDYYWLCSDKPPKRASDKFGEAYAWATKGPTKKTKSVLRDIHQRKGSWVPGYYPTSKYLVAPDAGNDVDAWLDAWRPVLRAAWPDPTVANLLGKAKPVLKTLDGRPLADIASAQPDPKSYLAEAWFGPLVIPVTVALAGAMTGIKVPPHDIYVVPPKIIEILQHMPPFWIDDFVTDPPDFWREVVFQDRREWVKDEQLSNIRVHLREREEKLQFLPFADKLGAVMETLFDGNPAIAANMTPAMLAGLLQEQGLKDIPSAYQLEVFIDAARSSVDQSAWDVKTLGTTGERLAQTGIVTLGEASRLTSTELTKALGVSTIDATKISESLQSTVVVQAVVEEYGNVGAKYSTTVKDITVTGVSSGYVSKARETTVKADESYFETFAPSLKDRMKTAFGIDATIEFKGLQLEQDLASSGGF
jgi:hypothetical protein